MKKIVRNLSTEESQAFWTSAEQAARVANDWPSWKRVGINVAQLRVEARPVPEQAAPPQSPRDKRP